jgi:hypothetical protein
MQELRRGIEERIERLFEQNVIVPRQIWVAHFVIRARSSGVERVSDRTFCKMGRVMICCVNKLGFIVEHQNKLLYQALFKSSVGMVERQTSGCSPQRVWAC